MKVLNYVTKSVITHIKILLLCLPISISVFAIDLGSLNTNFSNNGYDLTDINDTTHSFSNGDATVLESGNIIVASSYTFENAFGDTEYRYRIIRYLPNGDLDSSFGVNGIASFSLNSGPEQSENISISGANSDGILLAFSNLSCPPTPDPADCFKNITVLHYRENTPLSFQEIEFNLGGSYARQDDVFADMKFIAAHDKVVIVATVERNAELDTDFGISVLNLDTQTGVLSLDTSFNNDGKTECYFDHGTGESVLTDTATSVIYDTNTNTIIAGGSAYEAFNEKNMAFCEFDLNGLLVNKWSTQTLAAQFPTIEEAHDMELGLDENGIRALYVAGTVYDRNTFNSDFALTRFYKDIFDVWSMDLNFGDTFTGYSTVGFNVPGVGNTQEFKANMIFESDGSVLLAGISRWIYGGGFDRAAIALIKFRKNGLLYKSWGENGSGKYLNHFEYSLDDVEIYLNAVTYNPASHDIYAVGMMPRTNDATKSLGFIASMHNDGIFGYGFD